MINNFKNKFIKLFKYLTKDISGIILINMFGINLQDFLLNLGFSIKKPRFSNFGFAKISHFIENKKVLFETLSFKKNQESLRKDRKDAGALKVKKEILQKNYQIYSDLLLKYDYIKIAEKLVGEKVYPYVVMHIINDKKTKELIWHRDQYFHGKDFIGPKFKLYKLAIYL